LEPRLAYSLESEQIDGSVTFDTDDYIVEATHQQDQHTPQARQLTGRNTAAQVGPKSATAGGARSLDETQ